MGEKGIPPRGRGAASRTVRLDSGKRERSCGHRNSNFNVIIGIFVKKNTDF